MSATCLKLETVSSQNLGFLLLRVKYGRREVKQIQTRNTFEEFLHSPYWLDLRLCSGVWTRFSMIRRLSALDSKPAVRLGDSLSSLPSFTQLCSALSPMLHATLLKPEVWVLHKPAAGGEGEVVEYLNPCSQHLVGLSNSEGWAGKAMAFTSITVVLANLEFIHAPLVNPYWLARRGKTGQRNRINNLG